MKKSKLILSCLCLFLCGCKSETVLNTIVYVAGGLILLGMAIITIKLVR